MDPNYPPSLTQACQQIVHAIHHRHPSRDNPSSSPWTAAAVRASPPWRQCWFRNSMPPGFHWMTFFPPTSPPRTGTRARSRNGHGTCSTGRAFAGRPSNRCLPVGLPVGIPLTLWQANAPTGRMDCVLNQRHEIQPRAFYSTGPTRPGRSLRTWSACPYWWTCPFPYGTHGSPHAKTQRSWPSGIPAGMRLKHTISQPSGHVPPLISS